MSGQVSQVFLANNAAIAESSTTTASIVGDAWGSMTGALKSHMAAMIEGKETVGQALEGILKETLMSIATESAVKSLFSFASAIAAAAVEDYPGAAKFAAAGVEYAAVAALAGGGAYAMYSAGSHSSASAGGGAAAMPASAGGVGGPSSGGGGGTTIVVNLAGVAVTNQGAQDAIMRGVQHLQMRGLIRAA
jgi:hypothetical protein